MSQQKQRWGVILMNLGTPAAPNRREVRRFLREFLSDSRVVELPKLVWYPILYGVILPFRPRRVTEAYQKIWMPDGSPLDVIIRRQVDALQTSLQNGQQVKNAGDIVEVTYAMSYGTPALSTRVQELQAAGVQRILILPLYPQYSATTTATIYDQYASLIAKNRDIPDIVINKSYYQRQDYIDALAESVEAVWSDGGRSQRLLLSFHGIPQRCVDLGDPYYEHCKQTSVALADKLGLDTAQWAMSFQSRLGKARWLQPYTDQLLAQWAQDGVKSVDVVCPAFSADCLETIEEINIENKNLFLEAGGEAFKFIPCLNDREKHIEMMANIVREYIA